MLQIHTALCLWIHSRLIVHKSFVFGLTLSRPELKHVQQLSYPVTLEDWSNTVDTFPNKALPYPVQTCIYWLMAVHFPAQNNITTGVGGTPLAPVLKTNLIKMALTSKIFNGWFQKWCRLLPTIDNSEGHKTHLKSLKPSSDIWQKQGIFLSWQCENFAKPHVGFLMNAVNLGLLENMSLPLVCVSWGNS